MENGKNVNNMKAIREWPNYHYKQQDKSNDTDANYNYTIKLQDDKIQIDSLNDLDGEGILRRNAIQIIAVDLDGVLCKKGGWTEERCLNAEPIPENIKRINELYLMDNFIIIYTARRDDLIPASLQWLRRNGVLFHAISNNKMPADIYIDDKFINIDELPI